MELTIHQEIFNIAKKLLDDNLEYAYINFTNGIILYTEGWETENYLIKNNLSSSHYDIKRLDSAHQGAHLMTIDLSRQNIINISTISNDKNFITLKYENFEIYINKNKKRIQKKQEAELEINVNLLHTLIKDKDQLDFVKLPIKVYKNKWITN